MPRDSEQAVSFVQLGMLHPGPRQKELERMNPEYAAKRVTAFQREMAQWLDGVEYWTDKKYRRSHNA